MRRCRRLAEEQVDTEERDAIERGATLRLVDLRAPAARRLFAAVELRRFRAASCLPAAPRRPGRGAGRRSIPTAAACATVRDLGARGAATPWGRSGIRPKRHAAPKKAESWPRRQRANACPRASAPHIPVLLDEVDRRARTPAAGSLESSTPPSAQADTRAACSRCRRHRPCLRPRSRRDFRRAGRGLGRKKLRRASCFIPRRFSELVEGLARCRHCFGAGRCLRYRRSSMQLDQAARGFAFSSDGPLDMRMSQEGKPADFLNEASEERLPMCSIAMARSANRAASPARWWPPGR